MSITPSAELSIIISSIQKELVNDMNYTICSNIESNIDIIVLDQDFILIYHPSIPYYLSLGPGDDGEYCITTIASTKSRIDEELETSTTDDHNSVIHEGEQSCFKELKNYILLFLSCDEESLINSIDQGSFDKPNLRWVILDNSPECSICLDVIAKGIKTPCNHIFHTHCILIWLKENDNCPLCRSIID